MSAPTPSGVRRRYFTVKYTISATTTTVKKAETAKMNAYKRSISVDTEDAPGGNRGMLLLDI
jgi:hypothetical protein